MKRVFERIQKAYWHLIPYEYRPHSLWYKCKCFVWNRHTVIKSRYLPYTWIDRVDVLPHTMFEILSQFLEKECSPGYVEWYGECGHKITVDGEEKYVRDEMQDLYDWWHNVYNKTYREIEDQLWEEANKHPPTRESIPVNEEGEEVPEDDAEYFEWRLEFKNQEDDDTYHACLSAMNKLERMQNKKLDEMLHRLVNVRQYMWT